MRTTCEEPRRRKRTTVPLREAVAFVGEDLVLGCGTILWTAPGRPSSTVTLRADAARDRMLALLAVAGRGRLSKAALVQLDAALDDWRRGDRALAAIRLAFARLPRVRDLDEAHALSLADTALDAGLSPYHLLKQLGYVGCLPLLKFDPGQPRVPAGSGRRSGQWTTDAFGISFVPDDAPAFIEPIADGDGTLKPIPVFLRPEDGEADGVDEKARRLLDDTEQERIREGRPLPKEVPGEFEIVPLPEGTGQVATDPAPVAKPVPQVDPESGGSAGARPAVPQTDAAPSPQAKPVSGGGGSSTDSPSRDDEGPACPEPQDDVANGPNESGDNEEYRLSLRINPESPTPKYSTWTPNVRSKAYFLPSKTPRGRISFDDCKQRNTPTTLPILGVRRGDFFEIKAGKWGWEFWARRSKGFQQFENQVKNQNRAIAAEGLGRKIYYCVPSEKIAIEARSEFMRYKNSRFLVCP